MYATTRVIHNKPITTNLGKLIVLDSFFPFSLTILSYCTSQNNNRKLMKLLKNSTPITAVPLFGDKTVAAYNGSLKKGNSIDNIRTKNCSMTQNFFYNYLKLQ